MYFFICTIRSEVNIPRFYNQIPNYNHVFINEYSNLKTSNKYVLTQWPQWHDIHMIFHKLESMLQRRTEFFFLLSYLFSLQTVVVVEDYYCTWQHTHTHTMNTHICTNSHKHVCTNEQIQAHTHCPNSRMHTHTHAQKHMLGRTSQGWIITYNQKFLTIESNTTLSLYIYNASQRFPSLYYCTLCKPTEHQRNNGWI
jgi:hypothetical protein